MANATVLTTTAIPSFPLTSVTWPPLLSPVTSPPCAPPSLLLERVADMEVKDQDEAIPLHDACGGGYLEIIQHLFSRASGPECLKRMIETADIEGDTPLHHAARGEHVDVIRFLLGSGASPTTENSYGKTPGELADVNTDARGIIEEAINNSIVS